MSIDSSIAARSPERLSIDVREVMSRLGEVETYEVGQTVLNRGETNAHLYIIEEGQVDLRLGGLTASVGSGGLVGEHGFFEGAETATAVARHTN